MGNEVTHKNASLIKTGCGGCLTIIIIILLVGIFIYVADRTDKKVETSHAASLPASTKEQTPAKILTKKTEKAPQAQPEKKKETPEVNSIAIEGKPVNPVKDKTTISPKIDDCF